MKRLMTMCFAGWMLFGATGCYLSIVKSRAVLDLNCPEDQVETGWVDMVTGIAQANGCDKRAVYVPQNGVPTLNSPIHTVSAQ